MTVVIAKTSTAQVKKELAAMKKAGKRIRASKKTAKEYLLKHGFITKDGKLHEQYR